MAKRIDDNRIKHMHGVAEYMYNNAEKYGLNKEQMYVLGLLHDIGYVKEKAGHEQYGGDLLDDLFYIDAAIITWHGSTPKEWRRHREQQEEDCCQERLVGRAFGCEDSPIAIP